MYIHWQIISVLIKFQEMLHNTHNIFIKISYGNCSNTFVCFSIALHLHVMGKKANRK